MATQTCEQTAQEERDEDSATYRYAEQSRGVRIGPDRVKIAARTNACQPIVSPSATSMASTQPSGAGL